MTATKLNINIRSLLFNCEELAKDESNYWRLNKFIKSIEIMVNELKECHKSPQDLEGIDEYIARVEALKKITNYTNNSATNVSRNRQPAVEDVFKEVKQLQNAKHYSDLRKELINDENLRYRKPTSDKESMGEAVKFYNDTQEKIAEHMLALTRNLKEQTETANRIIKKDTEIVSRSAGMTERNISSLHKETEKLDDHSRNAWKCWMWLMIVFVILIFIGMVLFMKIMKKKKV